MKQLFTYKSLFEIFYRLKKLRLILTFVCIVTIIALFNFSSESTSQTKKNASTNRGMFVVSDSLYNLNDWDIALLLDSMSPGNSFTYQQETIGGNPGSFLKMSYVLYGSSNYSFVHVSHRYKGSYYVPTIQGAISSITYSEDIKRFSISTSFVWTKPLVFQGGNIFTATDLLTYETGWQRKTRNMVSTGFYNVSNQAPFHPDFSATGDTIWFGFSRGMGWYEPPPNGTLTYTHGSDNFSVSIYTAGGNNPPVAVDDVFIYESGETPPHDTRCYPLMNDYDPDRDRIRIDSVFNAFGHTRIYYSATWVDYTFAGDHGWGGFQYRITDGISYSFASADILYDCVCILQCLSGSNNIQLSESIENQQDTVDLELIRRFRDEVMEPSPHGARYVDMYYETTPEILFLMVITEPELATQAVTMVELLQPAIRNLLDGDGTEPITQTHITAIQNFFTNLSAAGTTSLQELIAEEMQRLGPLENYIGMPISEVIFQTMVVGVNDEIDKIPTSFALAQNYPNPFNPTTRISWQSPIGSHQTLKVYDLLGNEIAILVDEYLPAGNHVVEWDAVNVPSGVYFYKLQTEDFVETKKMLMIK